MKIKLLSSGLNVAPIYWALQSNPQLWNQNTTRTESPDSPHHGLDDIWARFGEAERAVSGRNDSGVKLLAEKIKAANLVLQAETSKAEQMVAAYTAEQSIRERITAGVAGFTSQAAASLLGAVNTSMGASYSASEGANKSYHVSVGVSESHDVPHDPAS